MKIVGLYWVKRCGIMDLLGQLVCPTNLDIFKRGIFNGIKKSGNQRFRYRC